MLLGVYWGRVVWEQVGMVKLLEMVAFESQAKGRVNWEGVGRNREQR